MGQLTNPEVYQCPLFSQPMHIVAHPLVYNQPTKAAHPAQRTVVSLSPHRQVGPWSRTALLPHPHRASPLHCAAPHDLAPEHQTAPP
jgi:hypothetical protein